MMDKPGQSASFAMPCPYSPSHPTLLLEEMGSYKTCSSCSTVDGKKWTETGILPSVLLLYTVSALSQAVTVSPPVVQWMDSRDGVWDTLVPFQSVGFLLWYSGIK